jgi:hypothetical protein
VIAILIAATLSASLSGAFDAAQACVVQKSDALEIAGEAADVTVDAALTACLKEMADLRVSTHDFTQQSSLALSPSSAKSVEEDSFNLSRASIRNRAILKIVEKRAANARQGRNAG